MAVIKIKRGGATAVDAPGQLSAGEMAVTYGSPAQDNNGGRLFIGNSDASANIQIGGQYFTSIADHVPGVLTASSALIADASSKLDDLKVDNIQVNGNNITSTNAGGHIYITPNGAGDVIIDGLKYPQADGSSEVGRHESLRLTIPDASERTRGCSPSVVKRERKGQIRSSIAI